MRSTVHPLPTTDSHEALINSIRDSNIVEVQSLLHTGKIFNKIDRDGHTPFMLAVGSGNAAIVQEFLKHRIKIDFNEVNREGNTAFLIAVEKGHIEIVRLLIQSRVWTYIVNNRVMNALMLAVRNNKLDIVKLLLTEQSIDLGLTDYKGRTVLMHAVINDVVEIVEFLLTRPGIALNATDHEGKTALMHAAFENNIENLTLLLKQHNINLNAADHEGKTALMHSAMKGRIESVKLLLQQPGIDPDIVDPNGNTALSLALCRQHYSLQFAEVIINYSRNKNATDAYGRTLLFRAVMLNNHDALCYLIEIGVDINKPDHDGKTPLIHAVEKGYLACAKCLIEAGADRDLIDNDQKTALMYTTNPDFLYLLNTPQNTIEQEDMQKVVSITNYINANDIANALKCLGDLYRNYKRNNAQRSSENTYRKHYAIALITPREQHILCNEMASCISNTYSPYVKQIMYLLENGPTLDTSFDPSRMFLYIYHYDMFDRSNELTNKNFSKKKEIFFEIIDHLILNAEFKVESIPMIFHILIHYTDSRTELYIDRIIRDMTEVNLIYDGDPLLYKLIQNELYDAAKLLINKGAKVDICNSKGITPFMQIIINLCNPYRNGKEALTRNNHFELAKLLVRPEANCNLVNEAGQTALMIAISWRNESIIGDILELGVDVNVKNNQGKTALLLAISLGHKGITLALIAAEADVNVADNEGKTALLLAISLDQEDIALALIAAEADVNVADIAGKTALMLAASKGNENIVTRLFEKELDLEATDKNGISALIYAILNNQDEMVKYLIPLVNKNQKDIFGRTPLALAILHDSITCATTLIAADADVNIGDNDGITPLMYAISNNKLRIIKKLLHCPKTDFNIRDINGNTALTLALEQYKTTRNESYLHTSRTLLIRGANIYKLDTYKEEYKEVLKILSDKELLTVRTNNAELSDLISTLRDHTEDPGNSHSWGRSLALQSKAFASLSR